MIQRVETLLAKAISTKARPAKSFDQARVHCYNNYKGTLDLTQMPCTSSALKSHIKRAYLKCHLDMNATKAHRQILEQVEQYGLKRKRDGSLVPEFVPDGTSMKPSGVPEPCTCPKCATIRCVCRQLKLKCCRYCGCHIGKLCRNPTKPNPPASHPATSNS